MRLTTLYYMYVDGMCITYSVHVLYVMVQFYPWFNFYFPLFLHMVLYDNKIKTQENKQNCLLFLF